MSKAFDEACIALQGYAGDEKGREIIATRIIDLARGGLIDPTALHRDLANREKAGMMDCRRLFNACFHAAVAISQAFIAVVAGVAVAFALWS